MFNKTQTTKIETLSDQIAEVLFGDDEQRDWNKWARMTTLLQAFALEIKRASIEGDFK